MAALWYCFRPDANTCRALSQKVVAHQSTQTVWYSHHLRETGLLSFDLTTIVAKSLSDWFLHVSPNLRGIRQLGPRPTGNFIRATEH